MRTPFHGCRALALLIALIAAGCGMRTSIQAESDAVEDEDPFGGEGSRRACGFGRPCDPANLGGRTCESLALGSGVIGCDPDTCYLDLSGCDGASTGGGPQGPVGPGNPGSPGLFGGGSGGAGTGVFGAGQSGFFGASDGGFFGAGNFPDGGFFGAGNDDEDGGVDEGGSSGGFFGSGFFGGQ